MTSQGKANMSQARRLLSKVALDGLSRRKRKAVIDTLVQLSYHFPNVFISQVELAKKCQIAVSTLNDHLAIAEYHSLIAREVRPDKRHGHWPGTTYHLLFMGAKAPKLLIHRLQKSESANSIFRSRPTPEIGDYVAASQKRTQPASQENDGGPPSSENQIPETKEEGPSPRPKETFRQVAFSTGLGQESLPAARLVTNPPQRSKVPPKRKRNKFARRCQVPGCDNWVPAQKGYLAGKEVVCAPCDNGTPETKGITNAEFYHREEQRRKRLVYGKRVIPRSSH